ncbi:MAG: Flavodoxin-5 domain-containing protein [Oscillospiraceae bacterium]
MGTIIAYSSTHGSAAECARMLEKKIKNAKVIDLKKEMPDPSDYDCVILGSSVYGGQIQQEVRSYCKKYLGILLQKPLGIYLTCLTPDKTEIRWYLENGFPNEIVEHLTALSTPGGAIYFTKMNFLERNISKVLLNKFSKAREMGIIFDGKTDYIALSEEKLDAFAKEMAENMERNKSCNIN